MLDILYAHTKSQFVGIRSQNSTRPQAVHRFTVYQLVVVFFTIFIRTWHLSWSYALNNNKNPKQILFLARCAYHIKPHLWGFQWGIAPRGYPTATFLLKSRCAFYQFLNEEITEACGHFHFKYIFLRYFQKILENRNEDFGKAFWHPPSCEHWGGGRFLNPVGANLPDSQIIESTHVFRKFRSVCPAKHMNMEKGPQVFSESLYFDPIFQPGIKTISPLRISTRNSFNALLFNHSYSFPSFPGLSLRSMSLNQGHSAKVMMKQMLHS